MASISSPVGATRLSRTGDMTASRQRGRRVLLRIGRRGYSITALALLAIAAGLSGIAIHRERDVAQARDLLDRQLSWGDSLPASRFALLPDDAPARARLIHALYLARGATPQRDPRARQRLLDIAEREIQSVIETRPHWAEAWVVKAYIAYGRINRPSPAMVEAISRSYIDGPLQREAGPWRVRMALANWDSFSPAVQDRIVAETVWLLQVSPVATRQILFEISRDSPAYTRIFLRWRLFQMRDGGMAR
jgi:hypothetical protein